MDQSTLESRLIPLGAREIRFFETLGSTNDEALAWLDAGASDCSLVVAVCQTRGKGRFNRRWISHPGASLTFTVILKPTPEEQSLLPLFSALGGLAVVDALESSFDLHAEIKWPNDVLLNRRKCCGILSEAVWQGAQASGIVIGIGVNLSRASLPAQDDSLFPPACLEEFTNKPVDALDLLAAVFGHLRAERPRLGTPAFFERWRTHLAFIGEKVVILQGGKGSIIGIEKGIDPHGGLIVQPPDGPQVTVTAGDLHLRPMEDPDGGNHAR